MEPHIDWEKLTRDQWLGIATDAAARHDGAKMVEALWASRVPQIIAYSLRRQHRLITWEDAEDLVAGAVEELYRRVRKGGRIDDPRALLRTVAGRRAITLAVKRAKAPTIAPLDENQEGESLTAFGSIARTQAEEAARAAAIQKLRGYVAKMGPGRAVTRLWRAVLHAIEEESSLTRDELADRLDMTTNYIGVLVYRGKKELKEMLLADGMAEGAEMLEEWTLDAVEHVAAQDEEDDDDNHDNREVY